MFPPDEPLTIRLKPQPQLTFSILSGTNTQQFCDCSSLHTPQTLRHPTSAWDISSRLLFLEVYSRRQGGTNSSVKGQTVNTLGFEGYLVSVTTLQLCSVA